MISKCDISIFKDCKIIPHRNFSVDYIETYLDENFSTAPLIRGRIDFPNSQFFKPEYKTTYKLILDEMQVNSVKGYNWNYMKVYNFYMQGNLKITSTRYYYFIVNKRWVSSNCIEFELELDVINTFPTQNSVAYPLYTAQGVNLSSKSLILRQHKNRWLQSGLEPELYMPKIDFYSEGMELPLYKTAENIMLTTDTKYNDNSWYLIYRSRASGDNSVIDLFCVNDDGLDVEVKGGVNGYNGSYPTSNAQYGMGFIIYGGDSYSSGGQTYTNVGAVVRNTEDGTSEVNLRITASNQVIIITTTYIRFGTMSSSGFTQISKVPNKIFHRFYSCYFGNLYKMHFYMIPDGDLFITPTWLAGTPAVEGIPPTSADTIHRCISINEVDRTDPLLMKIIKIPYAPFYTGLNLAVAHMELPSGWVVDTSTFTNKKVLRYRDVNLPSRIGTTIDYFLPPNESGEYTKKMISQLFYDMFYQTIDLTSIVAKNMKFESKLFHSDYYLQKFVYDSFSFPIKAEYLRAMDRYEYIYQFDFYVSTTLSSKMIFTFKGFEFESIRTDDQDYTNLMYVARNNEMPLYNSAYVNYIRSGYNFDVKTKNRQMASSILGSVMGIGGAIGQGAVGGEFGKTQGVGLLTSSLQNIKNLIFTTAQNEQNIQQKLKSAEMQGMSVSGSDDVDLMTIYTNGNKLKLVRYEVSPRMKKILWDLFFYTGYVANYQGLPNVTSRRHFNFVQAEIVFEQTPNLPKEMAEAIVERYKEGVTFLHKYSIPNSSLGNWDFEQQYENFEVSVTSANDETLDIE